MNSFADDDADLFAEAREARRIREERQHKPTVEGEPCPGCGQVHDNDYSSLPPDIRAAVEEMMAKLSPESRASLNVMAMPVHRRDVSPTGMVLSFDAYLDMLHSLNIEGPSAAATRVVLDELTDGRYSILQRFYTLQQRLLVFHTALKSLNSHAESVYQNDQSEPQRVQAMHWMVRFGQNVVEHARQELVAYAIEHALDTNDEFLENGALADKEDRSPLATMIQHFFTMLNEQ